MSTIVANGVSIAFDNFGREDAEPMLLISGLGAQMIRWPVALCEGLADRGYRVIRFDNRDAGLSTHFSESPVPDFRAVAAGKARAPYTLLDMAADALGLLDALSIGRAHVIGRSMGGMIAQLVAAENPERASSLVTIMSSTGNPALPGASPDVMALMTRKAPDPFRDEPGFLEHGLAFARRIASPGFGFDEEAGRAILLAEARRAYDPAGVGRQIAAIAATGDLRPRLAKIKAPTGVIHGSEDPLVPPAAGRDIGACIPGASLTVVDGMGHDLPSQLIPTFVDLIEGVARRSTISSV